MLANHVFWRLMLFYTHLLLLLRPSVLRLFILSFNNDALRIKKKEVLYLNTYAKNTEYQ